MSDVAAIIRAAEEYVKQELAGNDASHDYAHIQRVRNLALTLAGKENAAAKAGVAGARAVDVVVVELAALLHDIKDWKYSGDENAGAQAARQFLQQHQCDAGIVERVCDIVQNLGFKTELGMTAEQAKGISPELAVVQDADRLDAIGAIGIARCFTFGGHKNRPLHDPAVKPIVNMTKEQYMQKKRHSTTINHFHEKLLTLRDRIKTGSGREMAQGRHDYIVGFLEQFYAEWDGTR